MISRRFQILTKAGEVMFVVAYGLSDVPIRPLYPICS